MKPIKTCETQQNKPLDTNTKDNKLSISDHANSNDNTLNALFPTKVSLEQLGKIWNDGKDEIYNEEQLFQIREWLYTMADVILHVAEKQSTIEQNNNAKIIEFNPLENDNTKSYPLRPSEYRRAS